MTFPPASSAHLTDEEREKFVEELINNSTLLGMVRRYTMNRSRVEIPRLSIGTAAVSSPPVEAVDKKMIDPKSLNPDYASIVLVSSSLTLPWTVTNEFLEDNPGGKDGAEALIAKMMAVQAANDFEDLALNGDETSHDHLLRANEGWLKLATPHRVLTEKRRDVNERDIAEAYRSIPTKYRRNASKYRAIVGPNTYMDLLIAANPLMDKRVSTHKPVEPAVGGIPVVMSPYMEDTQALIVDPDNLIFGLQRDMVLRKTSEGAEAIKNQETYYALHVRADFQIQNCEAAVRVYTEAIPVPDSLWTRVKKAFKNFWNKPVGRVFRRKK